MMLTSMASLSELMNNVVTRVGFQILRANGGVSNDSALLCLHIVAEAMRLKVTIPAITDNYLNLHIFSVSKSNLHFPRFELLPLTRLAIPDRNMYAS